MRRCGVSTADEGLGGVGVHSIPADPELPQRITGMKHLLNGVAIAAALAVAAPAWAQGGGNPMGTPGPSPGGPGLTPYSTGAAPPAATSAQPPMHRPSRARSAKKVPPGPGSTTDTAAQLNQAELARLQAGAPPEPPPAAMSSGVLLGQRHRAATTSRRLRVRARRPREEPDRDDRGSGLQLSRAAPIQIGEGPRRPAPVCLAERCGSGGIALR